MQEAVAQDFISQIKQIPGMDTDYAIEVIGGSVPMYEKILKNIIHLMPSNIEQMDKFLCNDNNLQNFAVKVHGVKSSLRQAGHTILARDAEAFEIAAKAGELSYCTENYSSFRENLISFCNRVNMAISQSTVANPNAGVEFEPDDINDFVNILNQVKTAAEDYDTLTASELLTPLTKRRFGGNTDILVAKAMEALELFKPKQAQEYISELLKNI